MNYRFKLARRLARIRSGLLIATLLAACDEDAVGPESPDQLEAGAVNILPDSAALDPSGEVQFEAHTDDSAASRWDRWRWSRRIVELRLNPDSARLAPGAEQTFRAKGETPSGNWVEPVVRWTATGGTVSYTGRYTAGDVPGRYRVIAMAASGAADTAVVIVGGRDDEGTPPQPTVVRVELTPTTATLAPGATRQFTAVGKNANGETVPALFTFTATGGSIDREGRYTAGQAAGVYRVIATHAESRHADTAAVTISAQAPSPTLEAVVLIPSSVSLAPGGRQQFTATGKMSDGSSKSVAVTYSGTGGSISSSGAYTAGSSSGTYRVIAQESGGKADTSTVTITAAAPPPSSPPPSGGKVFFSATGEVGSISPWSAAISDGTNPKPVTSTARARNGSGAYRFEITNPQIGGHYSQTHSYAPTTSMGSPNGRYLSGYYSFWAYIDGGYTDNDWNMLLGWMTGVTGKPSPISHIGLEVWNGRLQVMYLLKNCSVGLYRCPDIPGYANNGGHYTMTAGSPAGVVEFPRNRWVHLSIYYKMARQGGQVTIWQDGVKIMDLTAPTMDTFDGHSIEPMTNRAGDMMLQFGQYGGAKSDGTQRLYVDDFMVTDYRVTP